MTRREVAACAILVGFAVVSAAAPLLAPHDPFDTASVDLLDRLAPPAFLTGGTLRFPLGTDVDGRDVLSAMLYGARLSLLVGAVATVLALLLGVPVGLLAGYAPRRPGTALTGMVDAQLAVPAILVALLADGAARAMLPRALWNVAAVPVLAFAIGLARWPSFARPVRDRVLLEHRRGYVAAARLAGVSEIDIAADHVLPNVLRPLLTAGPLGFALAVLDEATLSFLGVGLPAVRPSLGTLARLGHQELLSGIWWVVLFPAVALMIPVGAILLFGGASPERPDLPGPARAEPR
jgi:peptide/nickel transport system permease protein